MLVFLKALFLVLYFSYSTSMIIAMMLPVSLLSIQIIIVSTLTVCFYYIIYAFRVNLYFVIA